MNFSRNVSLLKAIDATLDDKIYLGVTQSKLVLDSIDANLLQIDAALENVDTNTASANTHLSNIATSSSNADTSLNAIELSASNIDTSLNNMEADMDAVNSKLVDIGVTLAKNDNFSLDQQLQVLKTSGNSRQLDAADYSSTSGKLYWENDLGADVIIRKISCTFHSSETTWNKIFTSTSSNSTSNLQYGVGDDNSGIDTVKLYFGHNTEIQPYMSMVFSDPGAADDMYYSYVIDGLNIKVADAEFFICELSGDYSAAGDESFGSSIVYEKAL